jgi:hypothetical protein
VLFRSLLFDSTSITHKVNCKYLPFAIRCVQSMHPSPGAMEKIFYAVIKCYLQSRKTSLFAGLDVSDSDYAASLENFIQGLLSKESAADAEFAMQIGCYQLLISQGGSRFDRLRAALCSSLKTDLGRFKRSFPDALTVMVRCNDITPEEFGVACSAEQLIQTTRFSHMKTIRERGALIQELYALFKHIKDLKDDGVRQGENYSYDMTPLAERLAPGGVLRELISYIFASPDTILPIHAEAMTGLIDALESADGHSRQIMHDFMVDCPEFRAFILFVFMGRCELGYGSANFTASWTADAIDAKHLNLVEYSRDTATVIDRGSLIRLRRYGIKDPWLNFIKSWTLGESNVLVDEDI